MKRNAVSLLKEVKGGILIVNGEESLHQKIVNSLADPGNRVEITTSSKLDLEELRGEAYEAHYDDYRYRCRL